MKLYLEVGVLWKSFLQVPAKPTRVEESKEGTDEKVAPEDGHDSKKEVHDGQLDQLLAKHGLPA